QSQAALAGLAGTAAWLRSPTTWALLDHLTADEESRIYRECVARIEIDAAAGALSVRWTAPISRLCAQESSTVPLPALPSRRLTPVYARRTGLMTKADVAANRWAGSIEELAAKARCFFADLAAHSVALPLAA